MYLLGCCCEAVAKSHPAMVMIRVALLQMDIVESHNHHHDYHCLLVTWNAVFSMCFPVHVGLLQ